MSVDQQFQPQLLSDIVRDSKLETEIFNTHTQHVLYITGHSARERHVRREERWVRDRFLGQGAYGTVYLERCDQGNKLRAVKEIKKCVVAGKRLEYMRELEAVMKFSHPKYSHCFVRSDGWFENADSIFIAMEYLEYGDLQRHLVRPLPEYEARTITSQVLEGLQFMHDNGFVHRDLKPGNIMVVTKGPDWFVKVADFGISKRRQQDVTSLRTLHRGTLGFAAPEVMGLIKQDNNPVSYTAAVDMWSLGSVAYIMLAHQTPFSTLRDLWYYVDKRGDFPLEALQENFVSDHGQQFILALLSPDPDDRPSSVTAYEHPWMTASLPLISDHFEASKDTMFSTASAAWSSISEEMEEIGVPTEQPIAAHTVIHAKETAKPQYSASYCSPYVESCTDGSDRPDVFKVPSDISEEGEGELLQLDSPHMAGDMKLPSLPVSTNSASGPLQTPPPEPKETPLTPQVKSKVSKMSLDSAEEETPLPMLHTRLRSPYSVNGGEKTDVSSSLRFKSWRNRSDQSNSSDGTRQKDSHEPGPVSGYKKVKSYRDALARNSSHFKPSRRWISSRKCHRCEFKKDPHSHQEMLEVVACGHVLCHYCLMERFALALVSPNHKLQCCDIDIDLQSYSNILIDPSINHLWCSGYAREDDKQGPDDDFILFLHQREVFYDPSIISEIERITGLSLKYLVLLRS
ncbi:kinase-like domain-containing protein [Hypoxylon sp. NC1633]|nr:kinase-like domain-containing protein [Hypoxylon sp. NC1633]